MDPPTDVDPFPWARADLKVLLGGILLTGVRVWEGGRTLTRDPYWAPTVPFSTLAGQEPLGWETR